MPCERDWNRVREQNPTRAAYKDPAYRRIRELLIGGYLPCVDCGTREDLTIDHVVPLSAGGTNDLANLAVRCRACNSRKGPRMETT